jgi:hypothetical protein
LAQNRSDARIDTFDVQHPADWALLDDLHEPAQQRDALRWAQALAMLDEQVFVPLSQQLRDERITQLRIVAPGDTALASFDISPNPRWKFWQRDASKAQLLAALGKPSP